MTLTMSEICMTSSKAATRGMMFLPAVVLGSGLGDRPTVLTGNQYMHLRPERFSGAQRLGSRILERFVVVLGNEERGHGSGAIMSARSWKFDDRRMGAVHPLQRRAHI